MKVCVAGACGRMGRRILELIAESDDLEIGGAFEASPMADTELMLGIQSRRPKMLVVSGDAAAEIANSDVLIDFTAPEGSVRNVAIAADLKKPSVVGTTGLSPAQRVELERYAADAAIVFAPNMSVGVNLLFKLTAEVARILGLDYNVEIIETHHGMKKDSPSGTAVRLAERAAHALGLEYPSNAVHGREGMVGARSRNEIGVHAVRGGDVVGDHTVVFIGNGERIELTHRAHSRDTFARGALRAARFVAKAKPGLYDMQSVLGLD